jgi:VIT1/CCC1 family predicted Fe2+/Mn2+ transporter
MVLIAGMIGAGVSRTLILLAGAINAIAGILSMSVGTLLSSEAERDALRAAGAPAEELRSPSRDAAVMAGAYAFGAVVPLLPFAAGVIPQSAAVPVAIAATVITLFALGVLKGIVSRGPRVRSGLRLLALATVAGGAGFLIGALAQAVFGLDL